MTPDDFRKMRKAARLTQAQIGARLGYSRQAVIHWEAGDHAIPDDVLDKLMERSLAPNPEPERAVTQKSHPHLYEKIGPDNFSRTVAHPHWWTRSGCVTRYLSDEMRERVEAIQTTTRDVEQMVWTPERAVTFIMTLLKKPREEAEDICRNAGFSIPIRDPYLAAQQAYFAHHPHGTVDDFLNAHPQFKTKDTTPVDTSHWPMPEVGNLDSLKLPTPKD